MKRTLLDFLKREYEVKLRVSSRDVIASAEQLSGVSAGSFPAGNEAAFGMVQKLKPRVLRSAWQHPDREWLLSRCEREGILPHMVFSPDASPEELRAASAECLARFPGEGCRFYEISGDLSGSADLDEAEGRIRIGSMREKAELLRKLDPEARIILGGASPMARFPGRSAALNRELLESCAGLMDMLGVSLCPEVPAGLSWDAEEQGIETDAGAASLIRQGLEGLERQIRETKGCSGVRIAVTEWGRLPGNAPQRRQDCVYFTSVLRTLRMAADMAGLWECGPLIEGRDEAVLGNVLYQTLLTASADLPVVLSVNGMESCPSVRWDGLPGFLDGGEIPLLEAYASRSRDGNQLFLSLTNRSPYRRAVPRVRFDGFPDMHPAEAFSLRSPGRMDGNTAEEPEKVYCKTVKLRNYRKMDHVTLEIPPCTTACMRLE